MKVRLRRLEITTRQTVEVLELSRTVTFLWGPVGTGKSTVARLIDYCLGGDLERTPAIQQEFVSARLAATLGEYECMLERGSADTQNVRVSWSHSDAAVESINAPLAAGTVPLLGPDVYNLSDLLFYLCGVAPIKVRKKARDVDSPMVRLSFRDIWTYCYLEQTHLDSSFFDLDDPFRGRKSQDAMRFFTGLHSERLSQLEIELDRILSEQLAKREAVQQIREFMARFELSSELDLAGQIDEARRELSDAEARRQQVEGDRLVSIHPTDPLRQRLRAMGAEIAELVEAIASTEDAVAEQRALRAELITTKVKAERTQQAGRLLDGVAYSRCPQCATDISARIAVPGTCSLCGSATAGDSVFSSVELEAMRRELNDRIDQIAESIGRRERALERSKRQLEQLQVAKADLDRTLQQELARYDSAFVESIRALDREIATLSERLRSLTKLKQMPQAINDLEEQAGAMQGAIDRTRTAIEEERLRLRVADENVAAIADKFKSIMLAVGFPGVTGDDEVIIDPRNWKPVIVHGGQEWTFWDAGSGGKKTLFNVCYALAVHAAGIERNMPIPNVLVIDSPTKNISDDENPELVKALYREIYQLASASNGRAIQFVVVDSVLVEPERRLRDFVQRHLAATPEFPSLIPYYIGP